MFYFTRLGSLLSELMWRRRHRWIEISIQRAWSADMAPRLFDRDVT